MKNAIQMFPVRIYYEYLPEVITGYQLDDLLYARSIQFIEDIIQQSKGTVVPVLFRKSNCANFKATR